MGKLIDLTTEFKREQASNKDRRRWKASVTGPQFTVYATYYDRHGAKQIKVSGTMTALAYWLVRLAALETVTIGEVTITPGVSGEKHENKL